MTTWVTSDLHLKHVNCAYWRGFESIEQHDQAVLNGLRRWVNKRDTLIILGDVSMNKHAVQLLESVQGTKRLVLGNHDSKDMSLLSSVFSSIHASFNYKECVLTHIPIHESQLIFRWKYNIHGHLHGDHKIADARYFNVNIEQHKFAPLDIDKLIKGFENASRDDV